MQFAMNLSERRRGFPCDPDALIKMGLESFKISAVFVLALYPETSYDNRILEMESGRNENSHVEPYGIKLYL